MVARWLKSLAATPVLLSVAFVPYVLTPSSRNLEGAGLGIAQAAARLLRIGQAEDAARLAALTVQLIPADPRGWVLLAEAQLRSGQNKEAGTSLARARELDPRNPGILFAQGSLALKQSQPQQAVELIRQGLKLDDKNAGAYFDLGNAYILMGKGGDALASFERASGLRGDFWEAINNQAIVLYEQQKDAEAIKRWRRVLGIKPSAAEPMLALAAALNGQKPGNPEKEQLWGTRLRGSTAKLLAEAPLKADVERAQANAGASNGDDEP
jgi:tetratricopeptide (TPR) repeat protein